MSLLFRSSTGVVSAPLYDSTTQRFAGMFTLADVVHLIQYYYLTAHEYENVVAEVEAFQLESLRSEFRILTSVVSHALLWPSPTTLHAYAFLPRASARPRLVPFLPPEPPSAFADLPSPPTEIEQAIDVPPPPTVSVHPDQPLSDACAALVRTHARRLPLVDRDDQTGKETIVSVLTQYRVLKFIAINVSILVDLIDEIAPRRILGEQEQLADLLPYLFSANTIALVSTSPSVPSVSDPTPRGINPAPASRLSLRQRALKLARCRTRPTRARAPT